MNAAPRNRAGTTLRLILAVSACWVTYLATSNYATCRAGGSGQVGCFITSPFVALFEGVGLGLLAIIKLLTALLP